jgi:hypothetical protein
MTITWRITALLFLTWCLVAQLYFVAIPLAVWYLFKVDGHELILVSILVDGYYQAFYAVPIMSFATIGPSRPPASGAPTGVQTKA